LGGSGLNLAGSGLNLGGSGLKLGGSGLSLGGSGLSLSGSGLSVAAPEFNANAPVFDPRAGARRAGMGGPPPGMPGGPPLGMPGSGEGLPGSVAMVPTLDEDGRPSTAPLALSPGMHLTPSQTERFMAGAALSGLKRTGQSGRLDAFFSPHTLRQEAAQRCAPFSLLFAVVPPCSVEYVQSHRYSTARHVPPPSGIHHHPPFLFPSPGAPPLSIPATFPIITRPP
jgi:hypothetical protein